MEKIALYHRMSWRATAVLERFHFLATSEIGWALCIMYWLNSTICKKGCKMKTNCRQWASKNSKTNSNECQIVMENHRRILQTILTTLILLNAASSEAEIVR